METPSVIDFFSGCGGTSQGFKDSGMPIAAGLDHDPDSAETFRNNFPEANFIENDIRQVTVDQVSSILPTGPLLFSGCAPCQPFSRQNKTQTESDPRRNLLLEFQRFIISIMPEYVVVENVPGLQKASRGGPLEYFVKKLESVGYKTTVEVLRALEYGVPQERRRLVVIASRVAVPRIPIRTHIVTGKSPTTVRDVIEGLPKLNSGGVDPIDPDHASMSLSNLNRQRILATPEGGDRRDWTDETLSLACHSTHGGHTDVYGRMWWDRPASGLTTRCLSYSNGRFGHPDQNRAISLREASNIQTFPPNFRFSGSLTSRARQVGNAVPPLMAQRIGESILQT